MPISPTCYPIVGVVNTSSGTCGLTGLCEFGPEFHEKGAPGFMTSSGRKGETPILILRANVTTEMGFVD